MQSNPEDVNVNMEANIDTDHPVWTMSLAQAVTKSSQLLSICSLCVSGDGCIRTPHDTGSSPHLTTQETWEKERQEGAREERGWVNVRDMFILGQAQIQRHQRTGAHVKWEIKAQTRRVSGTVGHFLLGINCLPLSEGCVKK